MRQDFTSPPLVRALAAHAPLEADASGMDIAERLSLWLDTFDAIGLQGAHQALRQFTEATPLRRGERRPRAADLSEDVARVRGALLHAIAQEPLPVALPGDPLVDLQRRRAGAASSETKTPSLEALADAAFAPYHQRHLELQRQMEQLVSPLRDHVRQTLGRTSPRLRQLAALDASFEPILAKREQALLPTTATLAARRFAHWRQQWEAGADEAAQDPAQAMERWRAPGGWLHAFAQEWRHALQAELEARLEPVMGLVEALNLELKHET